MKDKLIFYPGNFEDTKRELMNSKNSKKETFNFFNLHDVFQFGTNETFKNFLIKEKEDVKNFLDGFFPWLFLSIKNLKKIKRQRGPEFTKKFLNDPELTKNTKHFFLGLPSRDVTKLSQNTLLKENQIENYELPFISGIEFEKKDINKAIKKINLFKPDYLWISIACPKQNILAFQIKNKIKVKKIFAVGAAIDFLLGKKKEAPKIFSNIGLEWLYRLVTDFKYTKKKVLRHFKGLKYLLKDAGIEKYKNL